MCWSLEASAAIAALGFSVTAYTAYKKQPAVLWVALGYFSLMELLQAFTYSVIDKCDSPANQIATILAYLHIVFQPFFFNALALYFISDTKIKDKIAPFAYTLCFAALILMLLEFYPFSWATKCTDANSNWFFCGKVLCSVSGNWHIAWLVPLNQFFPTSIYLVTAVLLPLLYGSWKLALYIAVGPLLAKTTTNNWNEVGAIWCLFSVGLVFLAVNNPLRNIFFVRSWFLWPLIRKISRFGP